MVVIYKHIIKTRKYAPSSVNIQLGAISEITVDMKLMNYCWFLHYLDYYIDDSVNFQY